MDITVNGKKQQVPTGTTLGQLLKELDLNAERVAVERNLKIVSRDEFDQTMLTGDDTLEIVQFVGGG